VRTPAARRESLLKDFDRSGLSGPKFPALAGIKYQTFATWVRKRRAGQNGEGSTLPAKPVVAGPWWEAVIEPASSGGGLTSRLAGGVRAEVRDVRME